MTRTSRRKCCLSCLAALAFVGAGCERDKPRKNPHGTEVISVRSEGDSFQLFDGAVTLEVPEGAVTAKTEITVRASAETDLDDRAVRGASFEFTPDGQRFALPVTLTIAYEPANIPAGLDAARLRLHRFHAGAWELVLASRMDLDAATVTGSLEHFSRYAVAEASAEDLVAGVVRMTQLAATAKHQKLDVLRETIRQDVSAVAPELEKSCAQTETVLHKRRMLNQLRSLRHVAGLLDLDHTMPAASLCAASLDADQPALDIACNEGAACDDSDPCTINDLCSHGICSGTRVACPGDACM